MEEMMKIEIEIPEGKYCGSEDIKSCKLLCDPEYGEPEDVYCNLFWGEELPGEVSLYFHTKHPDCPSLKIVV